MTHFMTLVFSSSFKSKLSPSSFAARAASFVFITICTTSYNIPYSLILQYLSLFLVISERQKLHPLHCAKDTREYFLRSSFEEINCIDCSLSHFVFIRESELRNMSIRGLIWEGLLWKTIKHSNIWMSIIKYNMSDRNDTVIYQYKYLWSI